MSGTSSLGGTGVKRNGHCIYSQPRPWLQTNQVWDRAYYRHLEWVLFVEGITMSDGKLIPPAATNELSMTDNTENDATSEDMAIASDSPGLNVEMHTGSIEPITAAPTNSTSSRMTARDVRNQYQAQIMTINNVKDMTFGFSSMVDHPTRMKNENEIRNSAAQDIKVHTIKDWMNRLIIIDKKNWLTSAPCWTDISSPNFTAVTPLITATFPRDYIKGGLKNDTMVYTKIDGHRYFAGTLQCLVTINVQATQYGALIIYAWPYPDYTANMRNSRTHPTQLTQLPHKIIDITTTTQFAFELPLTGPFPYYDLVKGMPNQFVLEIAPWTKLYATSGHVEVTLQAHYKSPKLVQPTGMPPKDVPSNFNPRPVPTVFNSSTFFADIEQSMVSSGKISDTCASVSSIAGSLSSIPVVGQYASAISTVAGAAGGIASALGHSKPINLSSIQPMRQMLGGRMMNVDGEMLGYSTSILTSSGLDPLPGFGGSKFDQMSIKWLQSQSAFLTYFTVSTKSSATDVLWATDVHPALCQTDKDNWFHSPTPLCGVSSLFSMWRGPIRFTFKAYKSKAFQSTRLRIAYVPGTCKNDVLDTATIKNMLILDNCLSQVWDISGDNTSYEFVCPFSNIVQWRPMLQPGQWAGDNATLATDIDQDSSTGTLLIVPFTNMVSAEGTVPDEMKITVSISGTPATEFANLDVPMPFIPVYKVGAEPVKATNDRQRRERAIRKSKTLTSLETTFYTDSEVIMATQPLTKTFDAYENANTVSRTALGTCVGEVYGSARQLMKRATFHFSTAVGRFRDEAPNLQSFRYQPNNLPPAYTNTQSWKDYIYLDGSYAHYFQSAFMYRRGGYQVTFVLRNYTSNYSGDSSSKTEPQTVRVCQANNAWRQIPDNYPLSIDLSSTVDDFRDKRKFRTSVDQPIDATKESIFHFDVPYYSPFHCLFNEYNLITESLEENYFKNSGLCPDNFLEMLPESQTFYAHVDIYTAVKDDFDLGLFMGFPQQAYNQTAGDN